MTIIHAGRSSHIVVQESQHGVGSLLSAAELSMRRNVASDSAAWLCSRVEDRPRPSAPAGEILRTRGAGNHRPRERLGPSNSSKFHGCSVVDRGRTVGSRPRRQGIVAPQLLGESALRRISENFALFSTRVLLISSGLISLRPPPLSRTYRRIFENRSYYPSPALT